MIDERDLRSAVNEAYDPEGRKIWWKAWRRASDAQRRAMEAGVLHEWSGLHEEDAR